LEKTPFSVYDFFAYLSSGSVWIVTVDYVMGTGLLYRPNINFLVGVALVISAYVTGHIVAHFSAMILESGLVARLLGWPTPILMGEIPRFKSLGWIFRNYCHPLPSWTQQRVGSQMKARGQQGIMGDASFMHLYSVVTSNVAIQARVDDFRNLYGFARNMSFAFLSSATALVVAHYIGSHSVRLRWAILSAFAGVALLYRYLKFFRQFSYELLIRYAELKLPSEIKGEENISTPSMKS
jgi:hypothetical protein